MITDLGLIKKAKRITLSEILPMNLDAAKQESVELVLPVKTLYCRKIDKTWEANKMPKKSIRFIARDFERSLDYIKRVIDELGIEPDDYSDDGTPTYNEESQRKIQLWGVLMLHGVVTNVERL